MARAAARTRGDLPTMAMFFYPHPATVVAPERAPGVLTLPPRRMELLQAAGADEVIVQPFDDKLASLSAEAFVADVLVKSHHARAIVVGPDFRFGHRRAGSVDTLRKLSSSLGYDVVTVDVVEQNRARISSSRVRELVGQGDMAQVSHLLGRYHELEGTVIVGAQRGRTLGFPTANLAPEETLLPADGVYAVVAKSIGESPIVRQGVANLGERPTVGGGRSAEVHLFDFTGDLYGARLRVAFVARLREERRFAGLDALRAQIATDAGHARLVLATVDKDFLRWF